MTLSKQNSLRAVWTGLLVLGFLSCGLQATGQQSSPQDEQRSPVVRTEKLPRASAPLDDKGRSQLPDSPGAVLSQISDKQEQQTSLNDYSQLQIPLALLPAQDQSAPAQPQSTASAPAQSAAPAQPQSAPPTASQRPVGTAVAESPKASGIAASQPAGFAVAPAKQRRVRAIVIKTGAIVGAAVAIGTVVALTAGTPSKPPGTH
jgi:hypothetical protein